MSDLLPPNATAQERALSEAMARLGNVPVTVREVWSADNVPNAALPWLAWAFSVDEWDTTLTDAQKREVVRRAIETQRNKGTIGAVTKAIDALGISVRVQEWFAQDPQGTPGTFILHMEADQTQATQHGLNAMLSVVNVTKNLRSHMTEIRVGVRSTATLYAGVATLTGNEITLNGYQPGLVVINEQSICLGA